MYGKYSRIIVPLVLIALFPWVLLNTQDVVRVERVVDGGTLLLTNGEYVCLIGVDTPETKHPEKPVEYFGKEAYRFTKSMAEGNRVRLEYDQTRRDRYGRILAMPILRTGLS